MGQVRTTTKQFKFKMDDLAPLPKGFGSAGLIFTGHEKGPRVSCYEIRETHGCNREFFKPRAEFTNANDIHFETRQDDLSIGPLPVQIRGLGAKISPFCDRGISPSTSFSKISNDSQNTLFST
jgi:hypothetical protein